jgi:cytidine deaminase
MDDRPPHDDTELLDAARLARTRAYAPYSGFSMGAAVRLADATIVPGTLVENVSLGLAMCAERAALFGAVANGGARPTRLALVAPRTGGVLTYPCGACLQVALELGGPDLVVLACDADTGEHESAPLRDLLPHGPVKR